jgi:hypothetical protein
MFRRKNNQDRSNERATEYATCKDFQQIYSEDMVGLHQLAYLLTADQAKAEQCFIAGLDESIHGNPVFKQWARAWSKRAIIRNAIKMIAPVPPQSATVAEKLAGSEQNENLDTMSAKVATWVPFERFVFVMAVLEGYSLRECSAFLGCPVQDVAAAKSAALQKVTKQPEQSPAQTEAAPWLGFARAQVA